MHFKKSIGKKFHLSTTATKKVQNLISVKELHIYKTKLQKIVHFKKS